MSSIEDEKLLVSQLRNEEGMTLQEIANKLDKSIYWVKSRSDKRYEPKRKRRTSSEENLSDGDMEILDPKLSNEIDQVKKLKIRGLTYEQIAAQFNRSIYWVHTRLRSRYRPRVSQKEKEFQELRVIPWLLGQGHTITGQYVRSGEGHFIQEADIQSSYTGLLYITEVKVSITHHQFQTAIGQLLLHKFAFKDIPTLRLQIALPAEVHAKNITNELLLFMHHKIGIEVVFVP
jgi:hypothetical protein